MLQNKCWLFALLVFAIVGMQLGCGPGGKNPRPLDREVAMESMKVFLETWRDNGSLEGLKSRSPSIIGKDADWDAGKQLVSFEIPPTGTDDGSNLYLDVKLQLKDKNGKSQEQTIRYIIGTRPLVSIFRDN